MSISASNLPSNTSLRVRSSLFPETKDQKYAKSFQIRESVEGSKITHKTADFKKCRKVIWGRAWLCIALIGKSNIAQNLELKAPYRRWDGVNDKLRCIHSSVKVTWSKKGKRAQTVLLELEWSCPCLRR